VYIRACGDIAHPVGESPPDLKQSIIDAIGQPARRASRFMQLATIAASRCLKGVDVSRDTAVYLASGRGDLEIIQDVLEQVFRDGQSPKPLHFVNTVSNAACFQVAKLLGLEGRSSFVCHPSFAFENTLRLALADLAAGNAPAILFGTVDAVVSPIDIHRVRLGVSPDTSLGEGSHWLLLQTESANALAQIAEFKRLESSDALRPFFKQHAFFESGVVSFGPGVVAAVREELTAASRLREFTFARHGHYDSAAGAVIPAFLCSPTENRQLVYVNGDPRGHVYHAMVVNRI
jgi:hypothetical protein